MILILAWIGGIGLVALIAAAMFAIAYPWQSDPWGLLPWL
jgi:hypothetical protein